ncbi:SDR family NAD(P)-dependent oxidoreductase [Aliihoeflea sp. PC F10.4]
MSSLFDLDGKTAIVTGATKGIGRAIATRLAEAGAEVVVSSRDVERCETVAQEIRNLGGKAVGIALNISRIDDFDPYLERVRAQTSNEISIYVGNAALNPHYGPMLTVSEAEFDKIFLGNVKGNIWMAKKLVDGMKRAGGGAFVFVSSISAHRGTDDIGVYGASKAALESVARSLAVGLGADGIRANCVAPGLVRTDFAKPLWTDPERERVAAERYPLKRIGEPDDLAGAVAFLVSDAGRFVTGQTIVVDGGISIAGTGR